MISLFENVPNKHSSYLKSKKSKIKKISKKTCTSMGIELATPWCQAMCTKKQNYDAHNFFDFLTSRICHMCVVCTRSIKIYLNSQKFRRKCVKYQHEGLLGRVEVKTHDEPTKNGRWIHQPQNSHDCIFLYSILFYIRYCNTRKIKKKLVGWRSILVDVWPTSRKCIVSNKHFG